MVDTGVGSAHQLEIFRLDRACRRICELAPHVFDYKCAQGQSEGWEAVDFLDWWLPKLFSDAGEVGAGFAHDFMHKLWHCDDESFLQSWPYWKLHHPCGGLPTILE